MPNFKINTVIGLAREVRLSLRVEAALTGLGGAINRSIRAGSGNPSQALAPSPSQTAAPPSPSQQTSVPSQAASGQPGGQVGPRAQLAEQNRKLKQTQQQLASKDQELEQTRQQLRGKSRELAELQNQIQGGLPLPPPRETFLVAGTEDASWFLKSGDMAAQSIREILENNGLNIEGFGSILEFGCGVGRILRHWSTLKETEVHGTDYNPELISWCKENLTFAEFRVNDLVGGFTYEDEKFDFIYAWSVFTHLTEEQQFFWIEELSRVVRPGGYLFITTHGEPYLQDYGEKFRYQLLATRGKFYLEEFVAKHGEDFFQDYNPLPVEEQERFKNGQLVVLREEVAGSNECNTFHPREYVYEKLAKGLEVIDFVPGGAAGSTQDVYLLRKP